METVLTMPGWLGISTRIASAVTMGNIGRMLAWDERVMGIYFQVVEKAGTGGRKTLIGHRRRHYDERLYVQDVQMKFYGLFFGLNEVATFLWNSR